jgi:hypothetical protein
VSISPQFILFFHVSIFPTKLCQTSQGCGDSDRNQERTVTNIFQGEWGLINSQCNKVLELGDQNLNLDSQSSTEIPILMVIILPKSFLVFKWEEGEGGHSNLLTLSDFGCVSKGEGG